MSLESESSNVVVKSPKHVGLTLSTKDVDTGAQLIAGLTATLDPEEALRVRKKIDRYIMPLMCAVYVQVDIEAAFTTNHCLNGA
ncbi:hypothetical protein K503DRAFT_868196 [Rhizopogon vinicolor AM-OR11-026]|uniref:Uncharacterized protein n=1 Tax=Rhizopogon vinicolor AM-OR11-026 TaxID=1314800 RepID=A0A1B7MSH0_9AGAM|nr:hypothetical protein K503DRAFT_868196 [Rhizopogon vinicolor AM-OR11-026]